MIIKFLSSASKPDLEIVKSNLLLIAQQYPNLEFLGHDVAFSAICELDPQNYETRAHSLQNILADDQYLVLWELRAGYGSQSLLPFLDFKLLAQKRPKILVGFSDISALQAAFLKVLGWRSVHGPMIGSKIAALADHDFRALFSIFSQSTSGRLMLPLQQIAGSNRLYEGILQGGCFSVLTNLIGTPWQPDFRGSIVFLEDINEPAGRLLRMFDQWVQAKMFDGAVALVLGRFTNCCDTSRNIDESILRSFISKKIGLPCFTSSEFGHSGMNFPLGIGAKAYIESNQLYWETETLYD